MTNCQGPSVRGDHLPPVFFSCLLKGTRRSLPESAIFWPGPFEWPPSQTIYVGTNYKMNCWTGASYCVKEHVLYLQVAKYVPPFNS